MSFDVIRQRRAPRRRRLVQRVVRIVRRPRHAPREAVQAVRLALRHHLTRRVVAIGPGHVICRRRMLDRQPRQARDVVIAVTAVDPVRTLHQRAAAQVVIGILRHRTGAGIQHNPHRNKYQLIYNSLA